MSRLVSEPVEPAEPVALNYVVDMCSETIASTFILEEGGTVEQADSFARMISERISVEIDLYRRVGAMNVCCVDKAGHH